MMQIPLTALLWAFAPIPWITIAIHTLVKNERWRTRKIIVWTTAIAAWATLAYWLKSNYHVLFASQFSTTISAFFGVAILVAAAVIEVSTARALGRKRILGSSELRQSTDKLVTTGIYTYARHPRYVEHPLWFLGLGLLFGYSSLFWFAAYLFIAFAIAAHFEEQELVQRYGSKYLKYRKRTPAFFIG